MTITDRIDAFYDMAKEMGLQINGKPLTKVDAKKIVEAQDEKVEAALLNHETVKTSYGTLKVIHRKERKARNPKTQEEVTVAAYDTLKISTASVFETKLNGK